MSLQCAAVFLAVQLAAAGAAFAQSAPQDFAVRERGRELVAAGNCVSCHTVAGEVPFSGGRSLPSPFGTLVTPNLTPDGATGLGRWNADEFYRALHEGIGRDGAALYPTFPYPAFTRITREDSDAIFAYLRALDPATNPVRRPQRAFPEATRHALDDWRAANFRPGTFAPQTGQSPEWNRGAYLVQGLGHCGACHTPKNASGGDDPDQFLRGNDVGFWFAPDLTGTRRTGLGDWSEVEIVRYLATGANERHVANGPMAEVIERATSQMPAADLAAIAVFLKSIGGDDTPDSSPAADAAQLRAGEAIYRDQCSACHAPAGGGVPRLFPPLAGNASVQSRSAASLLRIVLQGAQAAATDAAPTRPAMPTFGWKLDDAQTAAVLTYVRNAWGNRAAPVAEADVANARKRLRDEPD